MSNAARTRRIFDLRTEARAAPFSMLVMVESNEVVRARVFLDEASARDTAKD